MSEELNPLEEELKAKIVAMTQESQERRQALIRQAAEEGTYYPGGINMTSFFKEIRELQAELAGDKGQDEVVEPEPVEEVVEEVVEEPVAEVTDTEETPEVVEEVSALEPEPLEVEDLAVIEEPVEEPAPVEEPPAEEKPKRAPRKNKPEGA
jgi:hypothetical protein